MCHMGPEKAYRLHEAIEEKVNIKRALLTRYNTSPGDCQFRVVIQLFHHDRESKHVNGIEMRHISKTKATESLQTPRL